MTQTTTFVTFESLTFPLSSVNYKDAHSANIRNICLLGDRMVFVEDSHQYKHKPESNGHIKYIGRRRLNKLRNTCFFPTTSNVGQKSTPANLDFLSIVLILL